MDESFQGEQTMEQKTAGQITTEYMKPVYGFVLKRCANLQDAEDLTQEICLKIYRTLLVRDDIDSVSKFIWTVAHNALANYYRGRQSGGIGVPIDDLTGMLPSNDDVAGCVVEAETAAKLHSEIAYLSKLQRKIVIAYYYENKKQGEIALSLSIPVGTVKWHLFEAKKDLKKGMDIMRTSSKLKFNPIKFALCGTNGSIGTKGGNSNFFRSSISQNIVYSVWKEAKTVNEIADCLGVSPVYVESEAEYLEEYGFLIKHGEKYFCNILLDEPTTELHRMHSEMYEMAAKLFANELYDELINSELTDGNHGVIYNPLVDFENGFPVYKKDKNFMLWSLIPYIAALSGEEFMGKTISFEEACTIRPDGGQNICYASVLAPDVEPPKYFDSMKNFCGPCWNSNENYTLWQGDSEWSAKRVDDNYQNAVKRDLTLLERFFNDEIISEAEYAYMVERAYLKTSGNPYSGIEGGITEGKDNDFIASLQIVWIQDIETKNRLIAIGDRIKEKYKTELDILKAPLIKAIMEATPKHLRKMQSYGLQYIFYSDGWFLLHCMKELVNNGKLKLPTEKQRKSLTTLILPK
jgi:RNA polymerase sigma factor (sigma-70 family)